MGGTRSRDPRNGSVGPGLLAVEAEIVGVGDDAALGLLGLDHPVRDLVALGVGNRLLERVEAHADLLLHVAGRGIAHHRIDAARLFGIEIQTPLNRVALARLHCGFCRSIDTCRHPLSPFRPDTGPAAFRRA